MTTTKLAQLRAELDLQNETLVRLARVVDELPAGVGLPETALEGLAEATETPSRPLLTAAVFALRV